MSQALEPKVGEGRGPSGMTLEAAIALADANAATGFPPPPFVQAILDAAKPAEVRDARAAIKRRAQAAVAAAKVAETDPPADDGAANPQE